VTCTCQHIGLCHRYVTATRSNVGECLALGCGCGGFDERGENPLGMGGLSVATWENVASPQGALTPAGSDHLTLPKNERG
jgi:hypothetical protein